MARDELLQRLRRLHGDALSHARPSFSELIDAGQRAATLFIGCSDSRIVPYLLTGVGPEELYTVRNVGALVPRCGCDAGPHGTAAAIEFALLALQVRHIVVCGHSHCAAMRALYHGVPEEAQQLRAWLELAREAALPGPPGPETLRRTEQRSVVLQLERLMGYPLVRRRVEAGELALHGWHYVIEDGEVHVFDAEAGAFVPAAQARHAGSAAGLLTRGEAAGPPRAEAAAARPAVANDDGWSSRIGCPS